MLDLFEERIVGRLQRHLEDFALDVVKPAVIAAAEPAFLNSTVFQRRAAMAAAKKKQPRSALSVTEGNQIFTENSYPLGYILQISR